jgi:hypothetical protein
MAPFTSSCCVQEPGEEKGGENEKCTIYKEHKPINGGNQKNKQLLLIFGRSDFHAAKEGVAFIWAGI